MFTDAERALVDQVAMLREAAAERAADIYRERDRQIAERRRFYGSDPAQPHSSEPGQFVRVALDRGEAQTEGVQIP